MFWNRLILLILILLFHIFQDDESNIKEFIESPIPVIGWDNKSDVSDSDEDCNTSGSESDAVFFFLMFHLMLGSSQFDNDNDYGLIHIPAIKRLFFHRNSNLRIT